MTITAYALPDPVLPRESGTYPAHNSAFVSEGERAHLEQWLVMVADGRIGNNPPASPEVVAQRAANDALFRSFRKDGGIW